MFIDCHYLLFFIVFINRLNHILNIFIQNNVLMRYINEYNKLSTVYSHIYVLVFSTQIHKNTVYTWRTNIYM